MPTQKSQLGPQRSPRILAALVGAFLFLSAASTARAQAPEPSSSGGFFSDYWIQILLMVAVLIASFVVYKKRRASAESHGTVTKTRSRPARVENNYLSSTGANSSDDGFIDEPVAASSNQSLQHWDKIPAAESEPSAYGAYRIDQEVGKLVLGKPHRMDVMASRISDDRRAIEASLVKAMSSSDAGEDGCRRARHALEEYGFVARQSAALLLGRDAWERSSAARTLGQMECQSSLSFLIEALHDPDSVVRNQAVASLGSLKLPAAIGALLDIARRHPDIPASLLSETLSACSVESLGYLDSPSSEPATLGADGSGAQIQEFESFVSFEDLPAGNEDVELAGVLTQLEDEDQKVRAQAVQELGLHHAQRSVAALSAMALNDLDSGVRAAAVSSLGSIDHESVFAPVLVALADESREVRAAAARTLSGLHFDRADAYVRVMETADAATLTEVARACVKTGIVAQAVDRLTSEDRHQAYEAFSLFSMLAKANEAQPILDVIEQNQDSEIRLCAVRVLNVAGQPELAPKLRELVGSEFLPENVRTAVLEVLYKLDQEQPVFD